MKKSTKKIIGFILLAIVGGAIFEASVILWFTNIRMDWLSCPGIFVGLGILGIGIFEAGETHDRVKAMKKKRKAMESK